MLSISFTAVCQWPQLTAVWQPRLHYQQECSAQCTMHNAECKVHSGKCTVDSGQCTAVHDAECSTSAASVLHRSTLTFSSRTRQVGDNQ